MSGETGLDALDAEGTKVAGKKTCGKGRQVYERCCQSSGDWTREPGCSQVQPAGASWAKLKELLLASIEAGGKGTLASMLGMEALLGQPVESGNKL